VGEPHLEALASMPGLLKGVRPGMRPSNLAGALVDAARDSAKRCFRTAPGLEVAGGTIEEAAAVKDRIPALIRPVVVNVFPRRAAEIPDAKSSVLIVDDDPEFRDSVARLLRSVGLETRHFSSVADFLKADLPDGPTCLVLDVRLPGQSGLELQRELAAANRQLPIIFITAHGDIPMTVQAMKGGAIEFLTKPFRDQELLDAIETGLARDRARRESDKALGALKERFDTLSSREREIMFQVTAGRLNKQIAHDIGLAESTVKVHRTNLMRNMKARSLPELSRMADILKPISEKPQRS
jgi:FixJ family two-component response regulator